MVVLGVVGEIGRHFQLNHTFQWFPALCFSGALTANDFFFKGEEKALNISTCGTSVT